MGGSGCPWCGAGRRTWTSPPHGKERDKVTFSAAAPHEGGHRRREGHKRAEEREIGGHVDILTAHGSCSWIQSPVNEEQQRE